MVETLPYYTNASAVITHRPSVQGPRLFQPIWAKQQTTFPVACTGDIPVLTTTLIAVAPVTYP